MGKWWKNKNKIKGHKKFNSTILHLIEGKYLKAYESAMEANLTSMTHEDSFISLLLAFKSASVIKDVEKSEIVLSLLNKYSDKNFQLAKLMLLAEYNYNFSKYGNCLDNLNNILQIDKNHILAHILLLKVNLRLKNFENSLSMFEWLMKKDILDSIQSEEYMQKIYTGIFDTNNNLNEITKIYNKLNKRHQDNHLIGMSYFDALIRLNGVAEAIDFVNKLDFTEFSNMLRNDFLLLAKKIDNNRDAKKLFQIYEGHLIHNTQNAEIKLALGILSLRMESYNEARKYIESSILIKPNLAGYMYLLILAKKIENNDLYSYIENKLAQFLN